VRLELSLGETVVTLTARTCRQMTHLTGLAAEVLSALPAPERAELPFGFTAGSSVETEIAGDE